MFRLLGLALFALQVLVVGSALVWIVGKIGFAPAQPYMSGIEHMFITIWANIKAHIF